MDPSGDPRSLHDLIQTAQRIQAEVARVQEELAAKTVDGESGGGLVRCVVSGTGELLALTIDPGLPALTAAPDPARAGGADPNAMLSDLIVGAVNLALARARELARQDMARVTGGLPMPPGMFGS
ncbi:MAG: YbaB/EbfC family nucleoid-associated protein [Verrucomicrobiota bacterium]